jgi:hypothetical protein
VLTGQFEWGMIGLAPPLALLPLCWMKGCEGGQGRAAAAGAGAGHVSADGCSATVVVGAVLGWFNRWALRQRDAERAERMGVLVATGLIVGDSLISVAYSAFLAAGRADVANRLAMPQPMLAGLAAVFALIARWRPTATRGRPRCRLGMRGGPLPDRIGCSAQAYAAQVGFLPVGGQLAQIVLAQPPEALARLGAGGHAISSPEAKYEPPPARWCRSSLADGEILCRLVDARHRQRGAGVRTYNRRALR